MEKVVQELAGERECCRVNADMTWVHLSVIGTSAAAGEESFRGGGVREREGGDVDDVFSLIDNRPR